MVPASPVSLAAALRALAAPDGPADLPLALAPMGTRLERDFLRLVTEHRLEAALAAGLHDAGESIPEDLALVVADDQLVRLQVGAVLQRAADALEAAGIVWLAFKGPIVAAKMKRPSLRSYNDLDLLVDATRFRAAIDALTAAGFSDFNENWAPYLRHRVGEIPMSAGNVSVDLHWHVVGLGRARRAIHFSPSQMLQRRRSVEIGGRRIPTFDPEDQLLHLAVHSGLSGAKRLDQFRDLAVVLAQDEVDWDVVATRARAAGVATLVAHVLDRASTALGVGIDRTRLASMARASLEPRRRRDGDGVTALRRSGVHWRRDTALQSGAAIAHTALSALPKLPMRRRGWDFLDERSVLFYGKPSGGPDGRGRFLDFVEASGA